jgi:hypothetical protein
MSTVLNNYAQLCALNPRAKGKLGSIFLEVFISFLKNGEFQNLENSYISTNTPKVQARHFSSLLCTDCKAGTRMSIKWNQNIKRKSEPVKRLLL